MKTSINTIKLNIPALIKQSGQAVFISNKKGYQTANLSETLLDFVRNLVAGIDSDRLRQILHQNKSANRLYHWFKEKQWLTQVHINDFVNTPNEKNYDYIAALNKNPEELLNQFRNAHIAIIGCGGTGSIVAQNLVAMGFYKLSVVDYDKIEYSNLNRQLVYSEDKVGLYKTDVLSEKLKLLNARAEISAYNMKIQSDEDLIKIYEKNTPSFVVCGIDTPPVQAKIHILKFCEKKNIPSIFGAVGIESGNYGPLIDKTKNRTLFLRYLNTMKAEYRVEDIPVVQGSLCPTNAIIASFIALDVFKWFSHLVPTGLNKMINIDFGSGLIKQSLRFDNC